MKREDAAPADCAGDPEYHVLVRGRRLLALRLAAVLTAVLLVVGAVVGIVMTAAQNADADRDLAYAAEHGSMAEPPGCVWLVVADAAGRVRRSPGTPAGFPLAASLRAATHGRLLRQDLALHGHRYRVLTTPRDGGAVETVYDLYYQRRDRDALLIALAATEVLGLAGAVPAAGLIARHTMRPLALALLRRRRFVADASHELRTPVARLHTRAQLLARRAGRPDGDGAMFDDDLSRLVDGTRHLGEVIDDLLLSTQVRARPAEFAAVDLAVLAEEARTGELPRADRAGLTLAVVREPGPHAVAGLESALRRVVTALLDNAVGHTPPGGRVTLTTGTGPGHTVRLTVTDDGVGLEPGDPARLFDRHTRGHTGAGARFGIGLSLVREIVDSHHGTVEATGAPGGGAVFTVTLPAWPAGRARLGRRLPRAARTRRRSPR